MTVEAVSSDAYNLSASDLWPPLASPARVNTREGAVPRPANGRTTNQGGAGSLGGNSSRSQQKNHGGGTSGGNGQGGGGSGNGNGGNGGNGGGNGNGNQGHQGQPLRITTVTLPTATLGQAYQQRLSASGGTPPDKWVVAGLPSGLTATGSTISGTPNGGTGTTEVTVLVTDSANHMAGPLRLPLTVHRALVRSPLISHLSPSGGPPGGGTSVTITGTNLGNATKVSFATIRATSFRTLGNDVLICSKPRRHPCKHCRRQRDQFIWHKSSKPDGPLCLHSATDDHRGSSSDGCTFRGHNGYDCWRESEPCFRCQLRNPRSRFLPGQQRWFDYRGQPIRHPRPGGRHHRNHPERHKSGNLS